MSEPHGEIVLLPISHLDTQWRWTVRESAAELLPATVRENVAAFAAFPSYCVNFDGAFRYRLLAEHHPAAFAEVKRWVEAGRWKIAGATWDALDVNLPSAESFVRQVLYGRRWFRERLGPDPRDLFLPDCFGFGAQVPVLAAHCALVGFATSKLRRFDDMRSAVGIPFALGWWEGADGSRLLAALDPGGYGEPLERPPAEDPELQEQLARHRRQLGRAVAVRFFGIGDRGGAPPRASLATLERAVAGAGPVTTRAAGSSETLAALAAELPAERLDVHRGELLLSKHGPGCYTSQVEMKRWNARNERLAAAAERASAAAALLGVAPYPAATLRDAWQRFLWHQFHDDLTGTSIPEAYRISWNDEAIAASTFATVLREAVGAVARELDTRGEGVPLVVFNPVARARRELVSAWVPWRGGSAVTVLAPDGAPAPAQVDERSGGRALVRFVAELPPLGFAVFDVREEAAPLGAGAAAELRQLPRGLESRRFRLTLDDDGNVASLVDHRLGRELLAAPLRLELFADRSTRFPAWEIQWRDVERGPVATVGGPPLVRALPSGPAATAIEVRRELGPSCFVERYRLAAGDAGDFVEWTLACRWRHRGRRLVATLTSTAVAPEATFDMDAVGVARGLADERLYEVPAQAWAALDDAGGWGAAMLTDRAGGWSHPTDRVLRRTLVRTPSTGRRFPHQSFQDLGDHRWELALASHTGDWRAADVPALAERFRRPPLSFVVAPAPGRLGRSWTLLEVEGGALAALKQHEAAGAWVVRVLDAAGRGGVRARFAAPVTGCRALDGCEDPLPAGESAPRVTGSVVEAQHPAFRPLTLGVQLAPADAPTTQPVHASLALPFDTTVVTFRSERCPSGFGRRGVAFPAELWPGELVVGGVPLALGAAGAAHRQALSCRGQRLLVPRGGGEWARVLLLAASRHRATTIALRAGAAACERAVPCPLEPLAVEDEVARFGIGPYAWWRVRPGVVRDAAVAWTVDHGHDALGALVAYTPLSLFVVSAPVRGARELDLPQAPEVLIFAAALTTGTGADDASVDDDARALLSGRT